MPGIEYSGQVVDNNHQHALKKLKVVIASKDKEIEEMRRIDDEKDIFIMKLQEEIVELKGSVKYHRDRAATAVQKLKGLK